MKTRIFLYLFILIFPVFVGFSQIRDNLLLIQTGKLTDFTALTELAVTPHFKGDSWVLVSARSSIVDILRQKGFHVKVVDKNPWSKPCYLVSGKDGRFPPDLPASFREIARVPEGVIAKGSSLDITDLIDRQLDVLRIHEREIPLVENGKHRFHGLPDTGYGPGIFIVKEVSESTLVEYVTRLQDFRTRRSCTDSNYAAGEWIHDTFEEFGYSEFYYDSFPYPPGPCDVQRNVVAVKPGTLYSDKVVVIGGHYDSMTNPESGCDPDTLAPGADDNASGTAVVLETARLLAGEETDLTLIFIAIASEEAGGYGSYHFAEEAYNDGLDIRVMFNSDMVANLTDNTWDIEINVDSSSIPYGEIMVEMAETYTDLIPTLTTPIAAVSDHYSFYLFGFNSVFAFEADFSPHWHRCTDRVENLHIPYFMDAAEMVAQSVFYSANMPDLPSGFYVMNVGDGSSLYLSWDPNTDPDLSEYRIYYGTQPGIYDQVKPVTTAEDTLTDLAEGTIYYISLSATDVDGYESPLVEEVEILVSSRPYAPKGITSSSMKSVIILEWEMNPGGPAFNGYHVYRWSEDGDPDSVLLDFVEDPIMEFYDSTASPYTLYGYVVTAVDNRIPPEEGDPSAAVFGRLATRDKGILVVDNTLDGSGGSFAPTDEDVDSFYSDVLKEYNIQGVWDMSDSIESGRSIMDYDLGIYSVVLWHSDVRGSLSEVSDTLTMSRYLEVGGSLWLSGWQLMELLTGISGSYYEFGNEGFIPQYTGVDSALTTQTSVVDFIGVESLVEGFPAISVDPENVDPLGALYNMDILLPPFRGTSPLYAYISNDSSSSLYHGLTVAVSDSMVEYDLVMTDFPLFFMERSSVVELIDAVMEMFGESSLVDDEDKAGLPRAYRLYQNYPNPFNPMTTIGFDIRGDEGSIIDVRLEIYDVRGRRVTTLYSASKTPGSYQVTWDGLDNEGNRVVSGVYLYTIEAGDFISTRKMMVMR